MLVEHFEDWQRYDFGVEWQAVMRWLEAAWRQTDSTACTAACTATCTAEQVASSGLPLDLFAGPHHVAGCAIHMMSTTSRLPEGCRYEVHRQFCDVQVVLEGQEWLFNAPARGLQLNAPFNEARDAGFLATAPEEPARLTLRPGLFAVLFPWDAHLPAMAVDNRPMPLRKCVAKIPLDVLRLAGYHA